MSEEIKLKPCPFCGGEAEVKKLGVICDEGYAVVCKECKARTKMTFIEKADRPVDILLRRTVAKVTIAARWNRRAGAEDG